MLKLGSHYFCLGEVTVEHHFPPLCVMIIACADISPFSADDMVTIKLINSIKGLVVNVWSTET